MGSMRPFKSFHSKSRQSQMTSDIPVALELHYHGLKYRRIILKNEECEYTMDCASSSIYLNRHRIYKLKMSENGKEIEIYHENEVIGEMKNHSTLLKSKYTATIHDIPYKIKRKNDDIHFYKLINHEKREIANFMISGWFTPKRQLITFIDPKISTLLFFTMQLFVEKQYQTIF
eukprot:NODE_749_length_4226_cov_0.916404.p3 type:complete len:174 gc:universal NODE_749_length_4226_cov_0.916404:2731-2210(-)